MQYRYLIFDVDNTLLDFGTVFHGTQPAIAAALGVECDDAFRKLDEECGWRAWMENGLENTQSEDVQQNYHRYYDRYVLGRYRYLLEKTGLSGNAEALAQVYLEKAANIKTPMESNTLEMYRKLAEKYRLVIATNGTHSMQMSRLEDFLPYTHKVFISEDVGAVKPSPAFFAHMLNVLGAKPEECLMIGDSMTNDIWGAKNAGMNTCYYRPDGKKPEKPVADYQIRQLEKLFEILP